MQIANFTPTRSVSEGQPSRPRYRFWFVCHLQFAIPFLTLTTHHSPTHLLTKIRHSAFGNVLFPFIEQRPANGTGAEIGHVLIAGEAINRFLDDAVVAAKHRAMAGKKELGLVFANPLERGDVVGNIRAVMSVDDADA